MDAERTPVPFVLRLALVSVWPSSLCIHRGIAAVPKLKHLRSGTKDDDVRFLAKEMLKQFRAKENVRR